MKLLNRRLWPTAVDTVGQLYVDGATECYILEDPVREVVGKPVEDWKVQDDTAIGSGIYDVTITFSNRFQRDMPLIVNVPGFSGIRFHWGIRTAHTRGCPLAIPHRSENTIEESKAAFEAFFAKLKGAIAAKEPVKLAIPTLELAQIGRPWEEWFDAPGFGTPPKAISA